MKSSCDKGVYKRSSGAMGKNHTDLRYWTTSTKFVYKKSAEFDNVAQNDHLANNSFAQR